MCFSVFFMVYVGIGFFLNKAIEHSQQEEIPFNFGWIFGIIGGIGILLGVFTLVEFIRPDIKELFKSE